MRPAPTLSLWSRRVSTGLVVLGLTACGSTTSPSPADTTGGGADTATTDAQEDDVADTLTDDAAGGTPTDDALAADATGDDDAPSPAADAEADVPVGPLPDDFEATAADFPCLTTGTKVRRFFVWNLAGRLDETLAVAASETGGTYPVGTLIQLVPSEAMIKRKAGFSPETNDWEFFALDVSESGTTIASRGAAETVNQFGGNCAS